MTDCQHERLVFSDVYPTYAEEEGNRGKANPIRCYWICEDCGEHGAIRFRCNHGRFMELVEKFIRNYESGLEWTVVDYAERWMAERPKRGNVSCSGFELGTVAAIRDDLHAEVERRVREAERLRVQVVMQEVEEEMAGHIDQPRSSVVYFVRNVDNGLVKIGTTTNLTARLAALGKQSGIDIELLGCIPGGVDIERGLHNRFQADRVRGEWFRSTDELRSFIRNATTTEAVA